MKKIKKDLYEINIKELKELITEWSSNQSYCYECSLAEAKKLLEDYYYIQENDTKRNHN